MAQAAGEMLYALLGHAGDAVRTASTAQANSTTNQQPTYELAQHLATDASDAALAARLLALADNYAAIDAHLSAHLFEDHLDHQQDTDSYTLALYAGLEEALAPYRARVLELEQRLLLEPELTLTEIQLELDVYALTLPRLRSLVERCAPLRSVALLDALDEAAASAVSSVRAAVSVVRWHVQRAFLAQLHAWLLYGELLPAAGAFLVRPAAAAAAAATTGAAAADADAVAPQPKLLSVWASYEVAIDQTPRALPTRLAETILFVGKAVRVLREADTAEAATWATGAAIAPEGDGALTAVAAVPLPPLDHLLDGFASELAELRVSSEPFELGELEPLLRRMKHATSARLWTYLWGNGLPALLAGLKAHYLLGRGELYHGLLTDLRAPMRVLPSRRLSLQAMLARAADGDAAADPYAERLSLQLPPALPGDSAFGAWRRLALRVDVPWPMQLLVNASALERYADIFSFLLVVKRTQMELHARWCHQKESAALPAAERARLHPLWRLRAHMAFFVDNLQYYLQVDVLEAQWAALVQTANQCADFEELVRAHEATLGAIHAQCFLQSASVSAALESIFEQSLELCHLLGDDGGGTPRAAVAREFGKQVSFFVSYLSGVSSPQASQHLAQLLLRLRFNEFDLSSVGDL